MSARLFAGDVGLRADVQLNLPAAQPKAAVAGERVDDLVEPEHVDVEVARRIDFVGRDGNLNVMNADYHGGCSAASANTRRR